MEPNLEVNKYYLDESQLAVVHIVEYNDYVFKSTHGNGYTYDGWPLSPANRRLIEEVIPNYSVQSLVNLKLGESPKPQYYVNRSGKQYKI